MTLMIVLELRYNYFSVDGQMLDFVTLHSIAVKV